MTRSPDAHSRRSPTEPSMAMSIPIPAVHNPYPSERSLGGSRPLPSPSSSRSPTQSSLSSYRAHPYPRRHSVSTQASLSPREDPSRIYLPPPNSAAPLHVLHERREREQRSPNDPRGSGGGGGDPRDHRDHRDPRDAREREREWRDRRPSLPRAQSDRYQGEQRGYHLPSFASISASTHSSPGGLLNGGPLTPTSVPSGTMGPPAGLPNNNSPGSSRAASPKLFSLGGLRPSYSYEPNGSQPAHSPAAGRNGGGPPPGLHNTNAAQGGAGTGAASCYRGNNGGDPSPPRYAPQSSDHGRERDRSSPPLRAINGYSPESYLQQPSGGGRSRSHSAASALSRYGAHSTGSSDGGDWAAPPTPREAQQYAPSGPHHGVAAGGSAGAGGGGGGGGGQSRRLAHLMSEQKRRESINTGFQSLRTALPSSIPTDSKAIILRKAVSHITHLETLLRKAGIPMGPSPPGLNRGDSGSARGGEDDEDDESNDVVMRETTGAVGALKMEKAGWEDVHVEDVEVKA